MPLDPLLIEVLACPIDKGPLLFFADEDTLYNPRLRRAYRIEDGIPSCCPRRHARLTTPSTPDWRRRRPTKGARDRPRRHSA